ncbi:endolytic transglycosylase MltG [Roseovarius spongiae]|uniref:Endolytic murein transglycosylase n=1 Tax=Roseovarius spongiae TaxID=2320272 RepID=A0A3A8B345_9RHOB|nr:endolytic transglycosylase MltG [Roseovarius spongiae]RKF14782.1 endolytic transglycosylase MltG [Roseovarius spongiae]
MWRNIASNALTFLVVIIFLLGGVILWGQNSYNAVGPLDEQICLRVPSGSSMRKVSTDLAEQGAVTSAAIFRIGSEYHDRNSDLKAGSWLIPPQASMAEITDIITRGGASTCGTEVLYRIGVTKSEIDVRELDPATNRYVEKAEFDPVADEPPAEFTKVRAQADTRYRVAVAEGATSWQIVDALKAVDVLEGEVESLPPEGSLAPDSYEVRVGDTRASLIKRMQEAQEAIVADAWQDRDPDLPLASPEEMLTLASIIEKETGVPEERGQVASVFVNRLNRGMRLQTDPTVIYGVTEGKGTLGRGLRQSELRSETPWNTYVIDGLPATPIANPGRASIEAAVHPAETEFVFFVADGSGGHAFAETLEEHNANVARWREIEAQRTQGE